VQEATYDGDGEDGDGDDIAEDEGSDEVFENGKKGVRNEKRDDDMNEGVHVGQGALEVDLTLRWMVVGSKSSVGI
jgi:hypothetical protein